jgi:hypothetical protein
MTVEKPKYSGKNCPSAILSTTHPTWNDLRSGFQVTGWRLTASIMAQHMSCRKKVRKRCSSSSFRETACIERYGYQMACAE